MCAVCVCRAGATSGACIKQMLHRALGVCDRDGSCFTNRRTASMTLVGGGGSISKCATTDSCWSSWLTASQVTLTTSHAVQFGAPLQHVHRSLFIHLQTDVRSIAAVERLKDAGDCSLVHLLLELIVAQRGGGSGPACRVQGADAAQSRAAARSARARPAAVPPAAASASGVACTLCPRLYPPLAMPLAFLFQGSCACAQCCCLAVAPGKMCLGVGMLTMNALLAG